MLASIGGELRPHSSQPGTNRGRQGADLLPAGRRAPERLGLTVEEPFDERQPCVFDALEGRSKPLSCSIHPFEERDRRFEVGADLLSRRGERGQRLFDRPEHGCRAARAPGLRSGALPELGFVGDLGHALLEGFRLVAGSGLERSEAPLQDRPVQRQVLDLDRLRRSRQQRLGPLRRCGGRVLQLLELRLDPFQRLRRTLCANLLEPGLESLRLRPDLTRRNDEGCGAVGFLADGGCPEPQHE